MAYSTTTLTRIQQLEQERAALYARAGERRYLDGCEIERLHVIRTQLARLWDRRRQEKAGAPEGAMPDNVRDAATFSEGRHNRSRRRAGRTWAEALRELEVRA